MRYKPLYNGMRITHVDSDGNETTFYADEVTSSARVAFLINMPVKDTGSRYMTDSDIAFKIDDEIIVGEETKRITEIPELKPIADNNTRRGLVRRVKVLVTT